MRSTRGNRVRTVVMFGALCLVNYVLGVGSTGIVHATLIDRGGGLIYDTDLNITWLADANYANALMPWGNALAWAENLTYYDTVRGVTYSDWRLPTNLQQCGGFNCTSSEMGHLFYNELGLGGGSSNDINLALFRNIQEADYWTSTLNLAAFQTPPWAFSFFNGVSSTDNPNTNTYAWAVRDGDVVVNNAPPVCSVAQAFPVVLWKPNHQFVPIVVTGVTDPDGDAVTITVTSVTQDEPVNGKDEGNTSPDAVIQAGSASVRAERSVKGNGRVYQLSFKAEDDKGGVCTGAVTVGVPHSLGKGLTAIDDGQVYDSTIQ